MLKWVCIAVASVSHLAVARTELPVWTLAQLPDGDVSGWSAPAQVDGHNVRSALAGKQAVLSVSPWWGDRFRPDEETVYLLNIRYKDVAHQSVIASSQAGLGRLGGLTELHRFGGSGDGQWKTAQVPVSWDLICRKQGAPDRTEIALESDVDLPVESITVTLADAAAAARYFEETRQWVARAQVEPRRKANEAAATQRAAETPDARSMLKGRGPMVAFAWDWMRPLPPGQIPAAVQIDAVLRARMARNEYEPVSFGVTANGQELWDVNYTVQAPEGLAQDVEVECRTAEYSAVQASVDYGATRDSGRYRLYPQRLWPAYAVDIPEGRSHQFWITLHTLGRPTMPGKYTCQVKVTGLSGADRSSAKPVSATLSLEIEILPVLLLTLDQADLALSSCTDGLPSVQEVDALARHNHTGMDLWFQCTRPGMSMVEGKLVIDWTYLDDWMARARRAGMTHVVWFLGGDPKGFPNTMHLERELFRLQWKGEGGEAWRREFIRRVNLSPDAMLPEIEPLYVDFVRQLVRHGRENHWPEQILQPFDEPGKWAQTPAANVAATQPIGSGPWIRPHFEQSCRLIRQADAHVRTALEAHTVVPCLVFLDVVNIFCTNRAHTYPQLPAELAAKGVALWQYANCDDQAPAYRTRYSFGFYFSAWGSRGSLVWAYNFGHRFDTSGIDSWVYAWGTPFGLVPTPALVGLREAMDDRRWVETYRRLAGKDQAAALLDDLGRQALAARANTRYDSHHEPVEPADMDRWRGLLQDAVVRLVDPRGAAGSGPAFPAAKVVAIPHSQAASTSQPGPAVDPSRTGG